MNNKIKRLSAILCALMLAISSQGAAVFADAETTGSSYNYSEERAGGTYDLPYGGLNTFNGKKAESRGDGIDMENQLKNRGYALITGAEADITEEEFEVVKKYGFWFYSFLNKDSLYIQTFDKVYIYRPLLEKLCQEEKESTASFDTKFEIEKTAVVIRYDLWYEMQKKGTISDIFNDNIPEFYNYGYLEINSPINVEVTLLHNEWQCYYKFYISRNTPFMVRLPYGRYSVVSVNNLDVNDVEEALPSTNILMMMQDYSDRDHALQLDISALVKKYNIPEGDISGKPDLSLDQNQNIPEEKTVVDEDAYQKAKEKIEREKEKIEKEASEAEIESERTYVERMEQEKTEKKGKIAIAAFLTVVGALIWLVVKRVKKINEERE